MKVIVMYCRRSLQDLTCEISSMSERLNVFCNHLQQLGSARFSSVFGDLCSVQWISLSRIYLFLK